MNFFILGCARSGSTLLKSMLNAHSMIHLPVELFFFNSIRPIILKKHGRQISQVSTKQILQTVSECWWLREAMIDTNTLRQQIEALSDPYEIDCLYAALLNALKHEKGTPIIGEKTIANIHHTDDIAQLFTPCKFLYLERDPRAILASRQQSGVGKANAHSVVEEWTYAKALYHKNRNNRTDWHKVSYETLVGDTEAELQKICTFLNIDFESSMLTFFNRDERGFDNAQSHHAATLKPVFKHRLDDWKRSLSPVLVNYLEYHLRESMLEAGYDKHSSASPPQLVTRLHVKAGYQTTRLRGKFNQLRRRSTALRKG